MKAYLNHFSQFFWMTAITIELCAPLTVQANAENAISQIGRQLNQTLYQRQQVGQITALQRSLRPIVGQDRVQLQCPVLTDNPAAQNPPACSPQNPQMAAPLRDLYRQNAMSFKQSSQQSKTCLDDKQKAFETILAQHEQDLETFLANGKNQTEKIRQTIKEGMAEIKRLNTLLEGGDRDLDYSTFFQDTSCQQTLSEVDIGREGRRGLIGIRESLRGKQDRAVAIKRTDFEKRFNKEVSELEQEFQTTGFSKNSAPSARSNLHQTYEKFKNQSKQRIDQANREIDRYLPALTQRGAMAPALNDGQFIQNLQTLLRPNEWREQFFQQCLRGEITGGYAQGGFDFLNNRLRRRMFDKKHDPQDGYIREYREVLRDIYYSPGTIQAKRRKLRDYDQRARIKNKIPVTVLSREGPMTSIPDYFEREVAGCQNHFINKPLVSLFNPRESISYQAAINRAQEAINKSAKIYNDFKSNIRNHLRDRVLNCQDIPYDYSSANQNQCLNENDPNFCRVNAVRCANNVSNCYQKTKNKITEIKNQKHSLAASVNGHMENYRRITNNTMAQILAQAKTWNHLLRRSYPTLEPLKLEENLFSIEGQVSALDNELNVRLLAGGDPNEFLRVLTNSIQRIKNSFRDQRQNLSRIIGDEKKRVLESYNGAERKWSELANGCEQVGNQYQEMMRNQMGEHQDYIASVNEVCQAARNNRTLDCHDENISRILAPLAAIEPSSYDRLCLENDQGEEGVREGARSVTINQRDIEDMCQLENFNFTMDLDSPLPEINHPDFSNEEFYREHGVRFNELEQFSGMSREDIIRFVQEENIGRIHELKRNRNNYFIRNQIEILNSLARKAWIKQCNSIREGTFNRLKEEKENYSQCLDSQQGASSVAVATSPCSRTGSQEIIEDEIDRGSDEIQELLKNKKIAEQLERSSGNYGEIRLPFCEAQSNATRGSNPLDRRNFAPTHGSGTGTGLEGGGTLPSVPPPFPQGR